MWLEKPTLVFFGILQMSYELDPSANKQFARIFGHI